MLKLQNLIISKAEGKISVRDLQIVSRESTNTLRNTVDTKRKSYRCRIQLSDPVSLDALRKVSEMTEVQVAQQNPTRVPRRADLLREKVVHCLNLIPLDATAEQTATLVDVELTTSAGAYVKEFMHSDNDAPFRPSRACLALHW
jgi:tRNA pseudouridine synthase 10